MGGFLKGAKFAYGENREAQFVIAWGKLIRDPEMRTYNEKFKTMCTIKTFAKNFLNCVVWGDNDLARTMMALEKDDEFVVIGMQVHFEYVTKKGERKTGYDMVCEHIIPPQAMTSFLIGLAQNKNINTILEENGEIADAFESANDFDPEDEAKAVIDEGWQDADVSDEEFPWK